MPSLLPALPLRPMMGLLLLPVLLLGAVSPAAGVAVVPSGADVDYQLGGAAPPAANVGIVVRDRTQPPAPGLVNVCYVNAFQTQPDERRFWSHRADLLLHDRAGRRVVDEAWGEFLLDLRTPQRRERLAGIVGRWIAGCAAAGFGAVELDNLDSWTRSDGLLRRGQALGYARLLVAAAHGAGLAVAQKNVADLDGTRLGFDLAIAEECGRYDECGRYVQHYGSQVLMVEYRARDFARTCAAYGATHPVVLRDRELTPGGVHRWC